MRPIQSERQGIAALVELIAMLEEIIFSVVESPEGGYEARALSAPIFTEANSLEDLRVAVRDAVECHFKADQRPKMIRLHFVRDETIAV